MSATGQVKLDLAADPHAPAGLVGRGSGGGVFARGRTGALGLLGHGLVLVGVLLAWQLLVETDVLPAILMPAPLEIAGEFASIVGNIVTGGFMLGHFFVTVKEIVIAFVLSVVLGVAIGAVISEFATVRRFAMPYVVGFNAAPKIAFAPVFIVWFGFGMWSKIAMGVAIGMFPVLIGTIAGLNATDRQQERLLGVYKATRQQAFRKVRMYVALPYIFAGLETAVVLTVIGAIIGEFTGGSEGLGYIVVVAQESLNLAQAFAVILLLSIIGVLFHAMVVLLQRRVIFWRRERLGRD
jgi:NitT/TauT family transport system permease protein